MSNQKRILYVEDHDDTRELIVLVLTQQGYEVRQASSVTEASSICATEKFDLYVLDLWLADGDGIELCRWIRMFDPSAVIVFFSAAAFEADRQEALNAGAHAYVTKPGLPSELCETIELLLHSQNNCRSLETATLH